LMGYTQAYGRSYDEWCRVKAERIRDYLLECKLKGRPIDLQELASRVYIERLNPTFFHRVRKWWWRPIKGRFTDFKPSAFIKNFINYLIERLKSLGYVRRGYVVETRDLVSVTDEVEYAMKGLAELYDGLRASEIVAYARGRFFGAVKDWVIELRDTFTCVDGIPERRLGVKMWFEERLVEVPSLETLVDICTWKDPSS